jgi:Mn-dependent DtxR family transcriptional regulator
MSSDIEEQELAMRFDPSLGLWELLGEAREHDMSQERQEILTILRNVGPKTPAQLAKIIEKSRDSVKMILCRMRDSGLVKSNSDGLYEITSF